MRKLLAFVALVSLATLLLAQETVVINIHRRPLASAGGSWTFVASASGQNNQSLKLDACTAGVCHLTVPSTGAGHGLILYEYDTLGSSTTISSVTGGCTWSGGTGGIAASAHIWNVSGGSSNAAYCTNSTASATSITITLSQSPTIIAIYFAEASWSGSSISYDTATTGSDASGTTLAGVNPTLAGVDFVGQAIQQSNGSTNSVTGACTGTGCVTYATHFFNGTDEGGQFSYNGAAFAFTSGGAPTWTPSATVSGWASAIALKGN